MVDSNRLFRSVGTEHSVQRGQCNHHSKPGEPQLEHENGPLVSRSVFARCNSINPRIEMSQTTRLPEVFQDRCSQPGPRRYAH